MKLKLLLAIKLIFVVNTVYSQGLSSFSVGYGLNESALNWSIAGNIKGENPNILSELIFKDIISLGVGIEAGYKVSDILELTVFLSKLKTVAGSGTDADYNGDNREAQTYNLNFTSNKGKIGSIGGRVLYSFFNKKSVKGKLGISYIWEKHRYSLNSENYIHLDNSYTINPRSYGVIVGSDYYPLEDLKVSVYFDINKLNFDASADWKSTIKIRDNNSFEQYSRGVKYGLSFILTKMLKENLGVFVKSIMSRDRYYSGVDNLFLANGTEIATKFNGGNRKSFYISLGVSINN